MKIRKIDTDSDILMGKGLSNYNLDDNAIAENIQTRIMSFLNDCWFDLTFGIDWFRLLGSRGTQTEIESTVRSCILGSYGVEKINSLSTEISTTTRTMSISGSIQTIFSEGYPISVEVSI